MKYKLIKLAVAVAFMSVAPGMAASSQMPTVVAQSVSEKLSSDTQLGILLDNPQAKAVLQKVIPDIINGEQIDMARGMTLRQLQQYAPDKLRDDVLKNIDAELAKIGVSKS